MIDKFTILNVKQKNDKLNWCRQSLLDIGVPDHMIEVFPAKYWKDYGSLENIVDAAVADGFEFFGNLTYQEDFGSQQRHLGQLCQTWSYVSFYRHLTELDQTHIFMHDDMHITVDFDTLLSAIEKIPDRENLMFAYISKFIDKPISPDQIIDYKNPWIKSLSDRSEWDCVKIYTPKSASILLEKFDTITWIGEGWFMVIIWYVYQDYFKKCGNIYELAINPELSDSEVANEYKFLMSDEFKKLEEKTWDLRFKNSVVLQHHSFPTDMEDFVN